MCPELDTENPLTSKLETYGAVAWCPIPSPPGEGAQPQRSSRRPPWQRGVADVDDLAEVPVDEGGILGHARFGLAMSHRRLS